MSKVNNMTDYIKSWAKTFSGSLTIFFLVILTIFPFLSQNENFIFFFLRHFTLAMIFSIFAASWDFLTGISGQISFGHAIFFGIGGYLCAYLIAFQGFPIWVAIPTGALGAVAFGLIIGIPCLRLRGPYLALGTLAFSLILLKIFLLGSLSHIFFGSEGISYNSGPFPLTRISSNPLIEYFIVFITMIISFIIIFQIVKSKFGTILKSIRDDETGADASGINTTRYKVYAFMISSLFAGIAGSFYALFNTAVNPSGNLGTVISFFAILMASLGGLTTISGSSLGAFFFIFLEFILIEIGASLYVQLIFAITLIIVVRFAEHGILKPVVERLKDVWDVLLGR
ncbi:MAG: branched-chain amino acid ABC transporter permease [Candidatus Lokiarchaeota archaeon]|nr:branched-chain amino acid ABC transporter permease [Candidatus Lokiarchaeota archaeon]